MAAILAQQLLMDCSESTRMAVLRMDCTTAARMAVLDILINRGVPLATPEHEILLESYRDRSPEENLGESLELAVDCILQNYGVYGGTPKHRVSYELNN